MIVRSRHCLFLFFTLLLDFYVIKMILCSHVVVTGMIEGGQREAYLHTTPDLN